MIRSTLFPILLLCILLLAACDPVPPGAPASTPTPTLSIVHEFHTQEAQADLVAQQCARALTSYQRTQGELTGQVWVQGDSSLASPDIDPSFDFELVSLINPKSQHIQDPASAGTLVCISHQGENGQKCEYGLAAANNSYTYWIKRIHT